MLCWRQAAALLWIVHLLANVVMQQRSVCVQVCSFTYGDISVRVREGALGDGLGAKVWSVCHIMAR